MQKDTQLTPCHSQIIDENEVEKYDQLQSNENITKAKVIASNEVGQHSIYCYEPHQSKSRFLLYHTSLGNLLRVGLCLDETSNRTVKRGMPYTYSYTGEGGKSKEFEANLKHFVNGLFENKQIGCINLDCIDILSEHHVTISYINPLSSWIIGLKGSKTVLFKSRKGLNRLLQEGQISITLYEICTEWVRITSSHKISDELQSKCSEVTLVGYYVGGVEDLMHYGNKRIIFVSVVYNSKHPAKYSRTPEDSERFFLQFNLNYRKPERVASTITTVEQFIEEVQRMHHVISPGSVAKQMKGKVM